MNAEILMLLGGVTAFGLTVYWVRGRVLREKYAVLWLVVASLLLLAGLFPGLIMGFAEAAHLSYPAAVLLIALAAIYVFSFTVSVSLTRLHQRNVRLCQELALLEERVRELELGREKQGPASGDESDGGLRRPSAPKKAPADLVGNVP